MTQHSGLTLERWSSFTLSEQILMIGNEMNRAGKLANPGDREQRTGAYERVLRLTDLTIQANERPALRRELLIWRDLAARLFVEPEPEPRAHAAAFRALLQFTPATSLQIPHVLGDSFGARNHEGQEKG